MHRTGPPSSQLHRNGDEARWIKQNVSQVTMMEQRSQFEAKNRKKIQFDLASLIGL